MLGPRVGESGCNVWTLARIAGHSSIAMSARYVHPGDDSVLSAISRLQEQAQPQPSEVPEAPRALRQ
jgi:hypothetical protein